MISKYLVSKLLTLDIEFGNSIGFFSLLKSNIQEIKSSFIGNIEDNLVLINDKFDIKSNNLSRQVSFSPIYDINIYDFVSRYIVLSNNRSAIIGGRVIHHNSSNIYYQYNTNEAIVPIGDSHWLEFSDNNSKFLELFDNVFYIRDEGVEKNGMKRWIIHHRIIANKRHSKLILRSCNSYFEGVFPFQGFIPGFIKSKLFRIRETTFPYFPIMAVGEVGVRKGVDTIISTKIILLDDLKS